MSFRLTQQTPSPGEGESNKKGAVQGEGSLHGASFKRSGKRLKACGYEAVTVSVKFFVVRLPLRSHATTCSV